MPTFSSRSCSRPKSSLPVVNLLMFGSTLRFSLECLPFRRTIYRNNITNEHFHTHLLILTSHTNAAERALSLQGRRDI
jgi:hypothetical protein